MSRIGRQPITLPAKVDVQVDEVNLVTVKGPLGTLERRLHPRMRIVREDGALRVERPSDNRQDRALHGLTRTLLANMLVGVTSGFQKRLEISGTGYRALPNPQGITLQVQKFSVRPDATTPVQVVARWVQKTWTAAVQRIEAPFPQSTFAQEVQMNGHQLIDRWAPTIATGAARRWMTLLVVSAPRAKPIAMPKASAT